MQNKSLAAHYSRLFFTFSILILLSVFACAQPQPQSFATATADTTQALTNQVTTLTSNHFVFIFNDQYSPSPYVYTFSLCAQYQQCTISSSVVYLQPHQSVNIYWSLINNVLYTLPATYSITATSMISGPNTNVISSGKSVINIIEP